MDNQTTELVITGRFEPGSPDWIPLEFEVPSGIASITVEYSYDTPSPPPGLHPNACDIGIFDPERFRGYSGGARSGFRLGDAAETTPGYLAGPIPAGTWRVLLAPYTVVPNGLNYRVAITLTHGPSGAERVRTYAPVAAAGRGRAWYRGDLHTHTVHSDGSRTPAGLAADARAAGLDFLVSTEHNTNAAHAELGEHAGDDLLILNGEEITTRNGHLVAAGLEPDTWLDWRFRAADDRIGTVLEDIHRQHGLAIVAHPHAPCLACQWKFGYRGVDAVEVWNGPWTPDDEVSLQQWNSMLVDPDRGWIPAVGSSDSHTESDQVGLAQTVVLADELGRQAILDGIRAGRSYVAGSTDIRLEFTATGAGQVRGIGERLPVPDDTPVSVRLRVDGVSEGLVRFVTDEGWAAVLDLPSDGILEWNTTPAVSAYVRAEVRTPGPAFFEPMAAFTNPIFLGA